MSALLTGFYSNTVAMSAVQACYTHAMTLLAVEFLESTDHRRKSSRNWPSDCYLLSTLCICTFGKVFCQKEVQIVNPKSKIHTSLVKRRVNEDDSNFFKQVIQVSSLFFFSNRLSIYCFYFYLAASVDC